MALRDDLVTGAVVLGAGWYFFRYMRANAINTVADLIPAVNPPGYTALQSEVAATWIIPTGTPGQFTSPLADYVTGYPPGTVYAILPNDPTLYIIMDTGEWYKGEFTKGDLVNKSQAYLRETTGIKPWWNPF